MIPAAYQTGRLPRILVKYIGGSLGIEILGTFRETVELLVQEHASQHQRKGSVGSVVTSKKRLMRVAHVVVYL